MVGFDRLSAGESIINSRLRLCWHDLPIEQVFGGRRTRRLRIRIGTYMKNTIKSTLILFVFKHAINNNKNNTYLVCNSRAWTQVMAKCFFSLLYTSTKAYLVILCVITRSMGAIHDGITGQTDSCPSSSYNIMSPSNGLSGNLSSQYFFSNCSMLSIKSVIVANK